MYIYIYIYIATTKRSIVFNYIDEWKEVHLPHSLKCYCSYTSSGGIINHRRKLDFLP